MNFLHLDENMKMKTCISKEIQFRGTSTFFLPFSEELFHYLELLKFSFLSTNQNLYWHMKISCWKVSFDLPFFAINRAARIDVTNLFSSEDRKRVYLTDMGLLFDFF